jgi:hypothetical protein
MKKRIRFQCLTMAIFSVVCAAQISAATEEAGENGSCVPGPYCARTDRKAEAYPEKAPTLGPAGSIVTDPVFGSRILRVTDEKTDTVKPGRPLYSPSSAEQNTWNKTSTMFYVTTAGGSFLLFHFDPSTMKARVAETPRLRWGPEPQFSFAQDNIIYGLQHQDLAIEQYDTSSGKVRVVNKPADCLKLRPGSSGSVISVSADDNRFMTTIGPGQDKNYLVYVYERNHGCRWYNPETGEIGGDWGPKGTVSVPDRFLVHNARMAKSGKFVYVTRGTNKSPGHRWVVWQLDTLNVSVCEKACSGHHVMGYSHIVGSSGFNHPMEVLSRPLDHLEDSKSIITGLQQGKKEWYDSHFSWNNVDPDDTAPVCYSTYLPNNSASAGTAPMVTGPWENEIDCAETDGKDLKVWRFAHTYSSAKNGFWSTPRGNVSQDGRFFEFTSDWENLLGTGPNGKNRMDVFIVELK